jgi:hypothetical protein
MKVNLFGMLSLILLSCDIENEVGKVVDPTIELPALVIEPDEINFGIVAPTDTITEVVTLRNEGDTALDILSVALEGSSFTAASAAPLGLLQGGESVEFLISYSPQFVEDQGWLIVESTDPELETAMVPLYGQGAYPMLVVDPSGLDMGWTSPGGTLEDGFTLRNEGLADLIISQTLVVGAEFSGPIEPVLPMTLAPAEEYWFDIAYNPVDLGPDEGALWVESNSPGGTVQARIEAGASDDPIAVCYVDPVEIAPLRDSADWIGEDSYDPGGAAITEYNWTLIQAPTGATASMPSGQENRYNFIADLAGTYVGQLVVHNEYGRSSEPCITSLEAIPEESLWIEMFWTNSGDDMDLHLLAPNGSLETDLDCYYMNCVSGGWLDWGASGSSDDDPNLDIDDIPGVGPENINILEPEDGMFGVYVHDFPGSVYSPSNEVTVRIYIGGVLEYEASKTISGENSYTHFASIDWDEEPVVIPH